MALFLHPLPYPPPPPPQPPPSADLKNPPLPHLTSSQKLQKKYFSFQLSHVALHVWTTLPSPVGLHFVLRWPVSSAHTHTDTHTHSNPMETHLMLLILGLGLSHFLTLTLYRQSADECIRNLNDDGTTIRPCPARGASLLSSRTAVCLFFFCSVLNLPPWTWTAVTTALTSSPRLSLLGEFKECDSRLLFFYMCNSSRKSLSH